MTYCPFLCHGYRVLVAMAAVNVREKHCVSLQMSELILSWSSQVVDIDPTSESTFPGITEMREVLEVSQSKICALSYLMYVLFTSLRTGNGITASLLRSQSQLTSPSILDIW